MKISAKELFSHLNIPVDDSFENTIQQIAKSITKIGFEVESIEFEASKFANFVVGFVEECEKHPNSQKLSICKVNTGKEILQVLCGAPNVKKGLKVVLATQGAIVPRNGFVIGKTKLAGYESQGMICSASEMGEELDDGTIIELPQDVPTGMKYAEYIEKNDAILDISITPNRGDAISYHGIAREIFASGFGKLPQTFQIQENLPNSLEIQVQENLANSVFFGSFGGVKLVPNCIEILQKCAVQVTKFPIVNYLNYITELYGQPMHLYDVQKIKGRIAIRESKDGEKLITISGQEITLQSGEIVVADDEKILSLAGIIGDARSAITSETQNFILESCAFNRNYIFQTIRKYSIHTSASFRFERYMDCGTKHFSPQVFSATKFANGIGVNFEKTFIQKTNINQTEIAFTPQNIHQILGFEISLPQILEILQKLGFESKNVGNLITAIIPSWRFYDVSQIYDIAEEILRFVGIENCQKATLPAQNCNTSNIIRKAKNLIVQNYEEIISLPFVSQKSFELFAKIEDAVSLLNPIDTEKPLLRSSLIPSILENISQCEKNSQNGSRIFEISKVFYKKNGQICEHNEICIANHGYSSISNPLYGQKKYDIFDTKEAILSVLVNVFGLSVQSLNFESVKHNAFHPHQAFNILLGKTIVAQIAQIHPLILQDFEIKNTVFIGVVNVANLPPVKLVKKSEFKPFLLPNVAREISILVDEKIQCGAILKAIQKIANKRFEANILEIFVNDEMQKASKKSVLIGIEIYQERTLDGTEIEAQVLEVVNVLKTTFDASLRG